LQPPRETGIGLPSGAAQRVYVRSQIPLSTGREFNTARPKNVLDCGISLNLNDRLLGYSTIHSNFPLNIKEPLMHGFALISQMIFLFIREKSVFI
jgi:hypothetical protein